MPFSKSTAFQVMLAMSPIRSLVQYPKSIASFHSGGDTVESFSICYCVKGVFPGFSLGNDSMDVAGFAALDRLPVRHGGWSAWLNAWCANHQEL
ncbi:MAG: hypothetical protein OSA05_11075 [Nitrospinaceae bacterium]|nr:hypothetical protein [Nitrospinaceae bacterium]